MKIKQSRFYIPLVLLFASLVGIQAQDWPQYLGPGRNAVSGQKNIIRSCPSQGPEVLWTVDVGIGFGGPVIKNNKVYLLDRDDKVGDMLRCFDFSTGKELWSFNYDAPGSVRYPGSRSVPTADGNYVYSCGPYGDLYCVDINTHQPVWHKNIWKDYGGGNIPTWAITQCPLIYGDLVIAASQAPQAGVVAYDKLTGNVKWKTPSLGPVGYVSPAVVKVSGEDHVVMITASQGGGFGRTGSGGKVVGINPNTGDLLWEYDNWQCIIPIPIAYDAGEDKMLILGGYEAGAALIQVKKAGSSYNVTEIYKNKDFGDHTKPPLFIDGYFYAQYSTNERQDGLVCMSEDGEVKWKTGRSPSFNKGGMIYADGLIIATDGETMLYLIEPDPSGFKPIVSAVMLEGNGAQNWAPLALADGKLLIRDQHKLVCVKIAQ